MATATETAANGVEKSTSYLKVAQVVNKLKQLVRHISAAPIQLQHSAVNTLQHN